MSKIAYIEKRFTTASLELIQQANQIIDEYQENNLQLTVRQLYYQFVARDLIANHQKEYNRLGNVLSNGRLAGLISWTAIEDRTRHLSGRSRWNNPGEIIRTCMWSFHVDYWKGQQYRPEVWIEKEALTGVIESICNKLDVPYFACRGYVSQSEMWKAAERFRLYSEEDGQTNIIIHLGDHDPSGMDMTRDIIDRHALFNGVDYVKRIALNIDQIQKYKPPPNPAKLTDSRASKYIAEYGNSSWELDALDPKTLQTLIKDTVLEYRDEKLYQEAKDKEMEYKDILRNVSDNWETLI